MRYHSRAALLAALLTLTSLMGCVSRQETPSPSGTASIISEASSPSSFQPESAPKSEPIVVTDYETLTHQPEFMQALERGENLTGLYLRRAVIDPQEVSSLLAAWRESGDATLEVTDFSVSDYTRHRLTVKGGTLSIVSSTYPYGGGEESAHFENPDVPSLELLCNAVLHLRDGREGGDLALNFSGEDFGDRKLAAYQKYLRSLEFCLLGQTWETDLPETYGGQLLFYFEREYGSQKLWEDYPDGDIPPEVFEGTIQTHFPITSGQLRSLFGLSGIWQEERQVYHYEGGRGGAYTVTTRIFELREEEDRLLIIYGFDDYDIDSGYVYTTGEDGRPAIQSRSERYALTVKQGADGGFQYLSNQEL